MKDWCRLAKWSLVLWWAILGALLGSFLYGVIGHSYLFRNGIVAEGLDVPLQLATIAGNFGLWAMAIFLIFIFVTLYDAEFAYYDAFIGRTFADAAASTSGVTSRFSYRFYYFLAVITAILLGLYLVRIAMPFALWLISAFMTLLAKGIGAAQILYANKRWLPDEFRPSRFSQTILWVGCILGSGIGCVMWALAQFKIIG
jgi:hypothetical protein